MEHISNILGDPDWRKRWDRQKREREKAEKMLREDHESLQVLASMIEEHEKSLNMLKRRRQAFLESDRYSELGEFALEYRQKVFDVVLEGKKIPALERAIRNMKIAYNNAINNHTKNDVWRRKYDHATGNVLIRDVVIYFLAPKQSLRSNLKCPFHDDRKASLKVYENQNRACCFGCNFSGSPIDFVMKIKNCDFKEAVEFLYAF